MRSLQEILADCSKAVHVKDNRALRFLTEELESLADPISNAYSLYYRAEALFNEGDLAGAELHADLAIAGFRSGGDDSAEAMAHNLLSNIAHGKGEIDLSIERAERAVAIYSSLHDLGRVAACQLTLGNALRARGDLRSALAVYEHCKENLDAVGDNLMSAKTMMNMATVHSDLGEFTESLSYYERATEI